LTDASNKNNSILSLRILKIEMTDAEKRCKSKFYIYWLHNIITILFCRTRT